MKNSQLYKNLYRTNICNEEKPIRFELYFQKFYSIDEDAFDICLFLETETAIEFWYGVQQRFKSYIKIDSKRQIERIFGYQGTMRLVAETLTVSKRTIELDTTVCNIQELTSLEQMKDVKLS